MPPDQRPSLNTRGQRQSHGASVLAESAVSLLNQRQAITSAGARQFILDHILRSVLAKADFDPAYLLDELRGHRLSVDAVIDIYVPTIARVLGEMWQDSDIDFASVTVGSMRLQGLLSVASSEALDFNRNFENAHFLLITVPYGEQHSLGAFVLAAQLRRLGARIDLSFCEEPSDFVSRVICDPPDMILFSCSSKASLETVSQLVLDISNVLPMRPRVAVGGNASKYVGKTNGTAGIDLVTHSAKEALLYVAQHKDRLPGRAEK